MQVRILPAYVVEGFKWAAIGITVSSLIVFGINVLANG